ncbi:hypothetical protein GGI00_002347, partial [Coemansia sp. RSA 2681]
MCYFVDLVILCYLMGLCNAALSQTRLVILKNSAGKVETFLSNDALCHKVSSSYLKGPNVATVYGGPTIYYKDSVCKSIAHVDYYGRGLAVTINYPIQSYRT